MNSKNKIRIIFLFFLTFLMSTVYSQTKNTGEIVSEGGSKIKVRPDIAIFSLIVVKSDTIEKNAIENLNIEIDALVKVLYKLGFTSKTIKISGYDISINNYRDDENKKSYTASNSLKLEFNIDTKLIDALFKEIVEAGLSDLEISFDTKLSDRLEKNTRLVLVQQAIEDAKNNANNIAKSLDIKLLSIKQVSKYKEGLFNQTIVSEMVKFTPPKIVGDTQLAYKTSFGKFQVEDVELEEKIIIVYEIAK
jgi:uncharacterized protein YggE